MRSVLLIGLALAASIIVAVARPANSASAERYIQGLTATEVVVHLRARNLRCVAQRSVPKSWLCSSKAREGLAPIFQASLTGRSARQILAANGTFTTRGSQINATAARYLGLLAASLTFDGADPARARTWVKAHVGNPASLVIAGVRFRLGKAKGVRFMHVAPA